MINRKTMFDKFLLKRENWTYKPTVVSKLKKRFLYVYQTYFFKETGIGTRFYGMNYKFYRFFLKKLKLKLQNYLYKHYLKKNNCIILHPSFDLKSKYFNYNTLFNDILYTHNMKGFFLQQKILKNFEKLNGKLFGNSSLLYGYNFYLYSANSTSVDAVLKLSEDKDYFNVINVKSLVFYHTHFNTYVYDEIIFNFYFNLVLLNLVEIYKIYILLYLNKACNYN